MATRKKKTEMIESADVAEAVEAKGPWPKVEKGSHLTVITHQNGRTELEWDDDALTRDVREAILAYELENKKPAVKAKATRKKKA